MKTHSGSLNRTAHVIERPKLLVVLFTPAQAIEAEDKGIFILMGASFIRTAIDYQLLIDNIVEYFIFIK